MHAQIPQKNHGLAQKRGLLISMSDSFEEHPFLHSHMMLEVHPGGITGNSDFSNRNDVATGTYRASHPILKRHRTA
jgi:hypothetical protein